MGLFDAFKQVQAEGPGRVMMIQLNKAKTSMSSMNETMRGKVLLDFTDKREGLLMRLVNMTPDGEVKAGLDLQVAGNRLLKSAPLEGYPLLLVGMWLESGRRPGAEAYTVHNFLDEVATEMGGSKRS